MEFTGKLTEAKGRRFVTFELTEELDIAEISRFSNNGVINAAIKFEDNRKLSVDQRSKAHALIGDIAKWSVSEPEYVKAWLKYYFIVDTGAEYFSLSNCDMTTARLFITYLIDFCFKWNVPFKGKGLDVADDIGKYLWLCIKHRKCAISGQKADIHHVDAIGAGRNRNHVDHSKHLMIALSRQYHQEAHNIGWETFKKKYHVFGIKLTPQDVKEFGIGKNMQEEVSK